MAFDAGASCFYQTKPMLKLFIFLVLLYPSVSAESLKVLCWNIRNYLAQNQVIDRQWRPDYPKPEQEKTALRTVLLEANADIIFFQEMGSAPYLRELQRDLATLGQHYPFRVIGTDQDTVRHLAVLSKFPLHNNRMHRPGMRRGILEVEFPWHHHNIRIFNIHLKSRYTVSADDPNASRERQREIQHLVESAQQNDSGAAITFLLGDFNEPPADPARQHLLRAIPGLGKIPAADKLGNNDTFYWQRGDLHESIDAIYYVTKSSSSPLLIQARILSCPNTSIASDHRPLLMEIHTELR